ncbi:hypothetical protein HK098_007048 [Nowakowskiella sp. JEL0407]|nr:hypothetical protein HK098_007048 [Nowakowskiella sp. JEL0407]
MVVTLLFITLVVAVTLTMFEPDPKGKAPLSRPHSRIELLYVGCRTVLTLMTQIIESYVETEEGKVKGEWAINIACLIAALMLVFCYSWYLPYYHFKYNSARAALMANFLWCSICSIFSLVRPGSDIGIIFLFVCPLVILAFSLFTQARRKMIANMHQITAMSPYLTELRARFILEENDLLFRSSELDLQIFSPTAHHSPGDLDFKDRQRASLGGRKSTGAGHKKGGGADVETGEETKWKERQALEEVNELYQNCLKTFPHSCFLHLVVGQFNLLQLGNKPQCLALYSRAQVLSPRMDEAFLIYRRQQLLNDRFSGGDVIDFIAYENHLKLARTNERKATSSIIQFWGELMRKRPNMVKLRKHGMIISHSVSAAKEHYTALIRLSPDTPTGYRLYGRFLMNVMNDNRNGRIVLQRADEMEEILNKDDDGEEDPFSMAMLENSGTLTISGNLGSLGKIIDMNLQATKILGWKRQELMGQNIAKIIPSPFAEPHDLFLKRYLDTGFAKVIDRQRKVLVLLKTGYILMANLCVKQVTSTNGEIHFIGAVRKNVHAGEDEDGIENFLIIDHDCNILHFTEDCSRMFNIKPTQRNVSVEVSYNIKSLIPDFEDRIEEFLSRDGGNTNFTVDGIMNMLSLFGESVEVLGDTYYILRIVRRPAGLNIEVDTAPTQSEFQSTQCPVFQQKAMPMSFSPHNSNSDLSATNRSRQSIMKKSGSSIAMPKHPSLQRTPSLNGSDTSRSSATSATSATSQATNYLKRVVTSKQKQSNSRLTWLSNGFILVILVLSGLAIYSQLTYQREFASDYAQLEHLDTLGELGLQIVSVIHFVRALNLGPILKYNFVDPRQSLIAVLQDIIAEWKVIAYESSNALTLNTKPISMNGMNYTLLDAVSRLVATTQENLESGEGFSQMEIDNILDLGTQIWRTILAIRIHAKSEYNSLMETSFKAEFGRASYGPIICFVIFLFWIRPLYVFVEM